MPQRGMSGVRHFLSPNRPFLGCAAGARCLFALGAGGAGVRTGNQPHSAGCCELVLCAGAVA